MSENEPLNFKNFHADPELRDTLAEDGTGFWDYLDLRGSYELAAAFAKFFWPDFVEVDGLVFLAERFKTAPYADWLAAGVTGERLEDVINHCHLYDLFPEQSASRVDLAYLEMTARTAQQTWTCALKHRFPDRHFVVWYATEPNEYGPTVSFWQESLAGA